MDFKATAFAPADAMVVDTEAKGVFDTGSQPPPTDPDTTKDLLPTPPAINGDHPSKDIALPDVPPASDLTTNVSSNVDEVAPPLPDHQNDTNSLFGDTDVSATQPNALEAPALDLRHQPATEHESSAPVQTPSEGGQNASEARIESQDEPLPEAMDTTGHPPQDTSVQSSSAPPTKPMNDLTIHAGSDTSAAQPSAIDSPPLVDREMEDAPPSGKVRPREEDEEDIPEAKRTKTAEVSPSAQDFKVPKVPANTVPAPSNQHVTGAGPPPDSALESGVHKAADYEAWPPGPLTEAQNKFLLERIRNTKKIKVSIAFKDPVNPVLLGIPTYPDIVKHPMDLSTMERKLKDRKYNNTREFMVDLDQMVENSELFNNKQHPVTQAGYNLRAYFLKGMGKMPRGSAADESSTKNGKSKKPTVNTTNVKQRRESRVAMSTNKSPAAVAPSGAAPQAAWPLQQDGTPLIRRDSTTTDGRPKREIHRPSKDLPYTSAKPRQKKYQQELRFCESVLTELLKPKYAAVTYPFITPVDPVALNIPSYLKIIKKPMDFGTIERNLKNGVYQSAKEFYADAQLVFQNCYKFNPEGDAVNKMGHQLEDLFESLWKDKADWLALHAPAQEQSHSEYYSDEEEEEEEEEDEPDPAQAQVLALQQQIAQLNAQAQQLLQQQTAGKRASPKAPSKKKKSASAPVKKKSLSVPPPAPKPGKATKKAKPAAPLTFNQKSEISEGISTLGDLDMRRAVQIIRNGCPHLANVNDDEMELDMDEINDDTLRELHRFIKTIRGPKGAAVADDDFEPPRQVSKQTASRPKKNKPMGKTEQEDNMRKIQEKLQSFQGGASGSSQSPAAGEASSDDDESSGSESEEE